MKGKKECEMIMSYYGNLRHGQKDSFVREVADAIGQSSVTVMRKMKTGKFSCLEVPVVARIVTRRSSFHGRETAIT